MVGSENLIITTFFIFKDMCYRNGGRKKKIFPSTHTQKIFKFNLIKKGNCNIGVYKVSFLRS